MKGTFEKHVSFENEAKQGSHLTEASNIPRLEDYRKDKEMYNQEDEKVRTGQITIHILHKGFKIL